MVLSQLTSPLLFKTKLTYSLNVAISICLLFQSNFAHIIIKNKTFSKHLTVYLGYRNRSSCKKISNFGSDLHMNHAAHGINRFLLHKFNVAFDEYFMDTFEHIHVFNFYDLDKKKLQIKILESQSCKYFK